MNHTVKNVHGQICAAYGYQEGTDDFERTRRATEIAIETFPALTFAGAELRKDRREKRAHRAEVRRRLHAERPAGIGIIASLILWAVLGKIASAVVDWLWDWASKDYASLPLIRSAQASLHSK